MCIYIYIHTYDEQQQTFTQINGEGGISVILGRKQAVSAK